MVTTQRMADLKAFVQFWKDAKAGAENQLNRLKDAHKLGISITDQHGRDILPYRIAEEIVAVNAFADGLTRAESLLAQAQAGHDV